MTKGKVMVVDDELILAKGIEFLLRNNGFEICGPVTTGEEALDLALAEKPDLALMDIALAGAMDGIEAARRLHDDLGIPAIFLTAYSDVRTLEGALSAEPYSYMVKPFEDGELLTAIEVTLVKERAQKAVRERERWLDAVLRGIGDGVLTFGPDGRVTFLNAVASGITGCSPEEAIGLPATEVLRVWDSQSGQPLQDLSLWVPGTVPDVQGGMTVRSLSGWEIPIEGSSSPILDEKGAIAGHVCVFRDVSVRLKAEERLAKTLAELRSMSATIEQKRALLQAIFQSMPCGMLAVDRQGVVRAINQYLTKLLGVGAEDLLNRPMGGVFGCEPVRLGEKACDGQHCSEWCTFKRCAEDAFGNEVARRVEMEHEVTVGGRSKTLRLSISAATGLYEGEILCFLLVEDRTEIQDLRNALRTEASFSGIVGKEGRMRDLFETIKEVAEGTVPVLIEGESGTGKELVAMAIHAEGPRAGKRFVAVNCGALPGELLESELFGHVKGAFTGAVKDKKGRFELADGGTLFLDEVGELSPTMQVKLLRVLQSGTFERVGGEESQRVDVRVISATNRKLHQEVAEGRFRGDLFYRLCVVPITIPPLRERSGDIHLLVDHILDRIAQAHGLESLQISSMALVRLLDHDWPGNVRELENVLQYAFIKSRGATIESWHLPSSLVPREKATAIPPLKHIRLSPEIVAEALRVTQGNRLQAAKHLGVSRATLYRFLGGQGAS